MFCCACAKFLFFIFIYQKSMSFYVFYAVKITLYEYEVIRSKYFVLLVSLNTRIGSRYFVPVVIGMTTHSLHHVYSVLNRLHEPFASRARRAVSAENNIITINCFFPSNYSNRGAKGKPALTLFPLI